MAKSKPKPPGKKPPYVPIDQWTMRCLYNRSDYRDRIASGRFVVLAHHESKVRENGSKTVHEYYGVIGEGMYVWLQWSENAAGEIQGSGDKDPKQFYSAVEPADYHLHGGDGFWAVVRRDPERILGTNLDDSTSLKRVAIKIQRAYGCWRKCKCECVGPVEARRQLRRVLARQERDAGQR